MERTEIKRYESLEEAIMLTIKLSGKEIKEVATALRPTDQIHVAYNWLIDALNPKKRQKLDMREVLFICHFCDRYDALYWFADECLHDRPGRKSLERVEADMRHEMGVMYEQITKSYQQFLTMASRKEKIKSIREGIAKFSDLIGDEVFKGD